MQADKFQPKLSDTAPEKDWRYAAKTVISIYVMNRAANGSVVWTKGLRQLGVNLLEP